MTRKLTPHASRLTPARSRRRKLPRERLEFHGAKLHTGKEITLIISPPDLLGFREKGRRKILWVTIGGAAMHAAEMEAERMRREKRTRRRGDRVTRGLLSLGGSR